MSQRDRLMLLPGELAAFVSIEMALATFAFPLLALVMAGIAELRSNRSMIAKVRSLTPVVIGLAAFVLVVIPPSRLHDRPSTSVLMSDIMTAVCMLIAGSGLFANYSRRSSAIWMACAGLALAFLWSINQIVV
jgi:hypothetical protein